jgi:hypothetical protein
MVTVSVAAEYVESAAISTEITQIPSKTAVTVVPTRVHTPTPLVRLQVIAPLPVLPDVRSVAVPPGASDVKEAVAVIVCATSETVNVTGVEAVAKRTVPAVVAVTSHWPVAV